MIQLKDIVKTDRIIRTSPDEVLSRAISKMRTSHDAVFVFDDKNNFLGVINPYYCLIKSSYPGNSKVRHCLYHTPKIRIDYSVGKVAGLFIESKIHYLPVFNKNDEFLGIISARHLLKFYLGSSLFTVPVSDVLKMKNKGLITIYEDDTIKTAIETFRKTKVSKLVILNKDLKLKGVLSYYDLISYLVSPRSSAHRGEREGNHVSFLHLKVKKFAKTYILTLKPNDLTSKALELILDKKIGSVIIVDDEKHPIGIITTKDFLRILWKTANGSKAQAFNKDFNQNSRQVLGGFFKGLNFITSYLSMASRGAKRRSDLSMNEIA
ncbi:hypothetical protein A2774_01505 [Candidatus Roizmanbacteria bacterium RIFCSPHIGHO2_01_FULL_39_12c]|uniref:CBS domain-containing protein n=1 Tax=Candidatus Roizmanbacteria bacterium RIFCSPHIGHO2_01_FULL_39_12c TaxID=1802031 RepID=A0A1F7G851_9BACT|nr:MAG: hypothetical protein A2774_01505 [Candidatus Roizmanbacteria bacterium RIFCSPHIGHO2_01_FULL_39_12c]OGK46582.1 MAG: hypothetical protein A2963_02510 [Candidatus Roizmanbacteria bacterium RIFCSPLOWO2_01_FULL_40_13]